MKPIFKMNGVLKFIKSLICIVITLSAIFNNSTINSFAMQETGDYVNELSTLELSEFDNMLSSCTHILGGKFSAVRDELYEFIEDNLMELDTYTTYYLIDRMVLNKFALYLKKEKNYDTKQIEFLLNPDQCWAPAIIMTTEDCKKTNTYYSCYGKTSAENLSAIDYINNQAERLINYGDFIGLLEESLNFIKENFPGKYNQAIQQVSAYIEYLDFRNEDGKISFINPLCKNNFGRFVYEPVYN